jgi:hypothetical protein
MSDLIREIDFSSEEPKPPFYENVTTVELAQALVQKLGGELYVHRDEIPADMSRSYGLLDAYKMAQVLRNRLVFRDLDDEHGAE